jgi:hypothetical protein
MAERFAAPPSVPLTLSEDLVLSLSKALVLSLSKDAPAPPTVRASGIILRQAQDEVGWGQDEIGYCEARERSGRELSNV